MACILKPFYCTHTTSKNVGCKIQNVETLTYLDTDDGAFKDSPTTPFIELTESTEMPTVYNVLWNLGSEWRDGEYLVVFYESTEAYEATLTLIRIQKFLVHKGRINFIEGFVTL